jgi:hypothetical protein
MDIYRTNNVEKYECVKLCHQFSRINDNYREDVVDVFFNENFDAPREESYGWEYLDSCLKDDDEDYYKIIKTMTYKDKKKQFETTHAKILYPQ